MPIEKLIEFATTGAKNTTGLDLEEGFPSNVKPARQWVNWLFNSLSVKINELIDYQGEDDPFPQYVRVDGKRPRTMFKMEHNNGTPYAVSFGYSDYDVYHAPAGAVYDLGDCLNDEALTFAAPVSDYVVEGITLGGALNKKGFMLNFDGYIQCGNYAGQGDTGFSYPSATLVFYDGEDNQLLEAALALSTITGSLANSGNVGHITFRVGGVGFDLYDIRKSDGSIPSQIKAKLRMNCNSSSHGGSTDLQIFTIEGFSITCSY